MFLVPGNISWVLSTDLVCEFVTMTEGIIHDADWKAVIFVFIAQSCWKSRLFEFSRDTNSRRQEKTTSLWKYFVAMAFLQCLHFYCNGISALVFASLICLWLQTKLPSFLTTSRTGKYRQGFLRKIKILHQLHEFFHIGYRAISACYCTVPHAMLINVLQVSSKYEKRLKYLSILHEATMR